MNKMTQLIDKLKHQFHKLSDYDKLESYHKGIYNELQQYKKAYPKLEIEKESYKARYEQELTHRKILDDKLLTNLENKYDSIGLPELDIKKLKATLKLADNYTLNQVMELIKIDYIDVTSVMANSLEDANKYEISIASNAIRRRMAKWIEILSVNKKAEEFIDRATGEIKSQSNKK